jgi:Na+-driven multidrug efflux pump
VNIGLATLFVFVLKKGVAGAAVATVIANGVELLVLVRARRGSSLRLATEWRHPTPAP